MLSLSYVVQYGVGTPSSTLSTRTTLHTLRGLTHNTTYAVRVRALNQRGAGSYSATRNATTRVRAPVITRFVAVGSGTNVIGYSVGDNITIGNTIVVSGYG